MVTAGRASGPAGGMMAGGTGQWPEMRLWPLFAGFGPMGALPTVPGLARALTALALGSWDLISVPDLAEVSELIVSEMSANVPAGERVCTHWQRSASARPTRRWRLTSPQGLSREKTRSAGLSVSGCSAPRSARSMP
jgi:hypothetical protein